MKVTFCPPAKEAYKTVKKFEDAFAKKIGAPFCVATSSGYSALFLAMRALAIRKDDEVIVPDFTMVATANAVQMTGATPVFVDADPSTWNIDVTKIKKAITKKTKAIVVVHIYGNPCNMKRIMEIARAYKLYVIEDVAEAHGAKVAGKSLGTIGDVGCFSFYSNKIVSTGEGGAIVTNNPVIALRAQSQRSYSFGKGYKHKEFGWGFRMNPYGAKIGLRAIRNMDKEIAARKRIACFYDQNLTNSSKQVAVGKKRVYWMYGVLSIFKRELQKHLEEHGVETRDFFAPMTAQPMYAGYRGPVANELSKNGLLLPTMSSLTRKELQYVVDTFNSFFR